MSEARAGDHVIRAGVGFVNISAPGFHRHARHFYKARCDFRNPDAGFSPVPHFLLCRAIELALKAHHLEERRQPEVKGTFGHDLIKAYRDLPPALQILSAAELVVLEQAHEIYVGKGFEYVQPVDYLTGFTRFPDIDLLDGVARKLLGLGPRIEGDADIRASRWRSWLRRISARWCPR